VQLFRHSPLSAKNDIPTEGLVAAAGLNYLKHRLLRHNTHKTDQQKKANFGDEHTKAGGAADFAFVVCDPLDSQSVWC
jgi:hypothetical protein